MGRPHKQQGDEACARRSTQNVVSAQPACLARSPLAASRLWCARQHHKRCSCALMDARHRCVQTHQNGAVRPALTTANVPDQQS
eukprot:3211146-Amphidinium_carterae.1